MAAGDTLRRITPNDQLILDAAGNIVGLKNPNASGSDLRFDATGVGIKERLSIAAQRAQAFNPITAPVYGSGPSAGQTAPTITQDLAAGSGLTVLDRFDTAGVLGSKCRLLAGLPLLFTSFGQPYQLLGFVCSTNASVADASKPAGNNPSYSPNQLGVSAEYGANQARTFMEGYGQTIDTVTDADVVQFLIAPFNSNLYRVLIDGQYISKTPSTITNGGNTFLTLTFSGRAQRRITLEAQFPLVGIQRSPLSSYVAPSDDYIKAAFITDSYGVPTGLATADGFFQGYADVAGALLGWRDVRRCSIGGTGFLSFGAGSAYSNYRQRVPDAALHSPDVLVLQGSINDYNNGVTPAALKAEVIATIGVARAAMPNIPIFVTGIPATNTGPNAALLALEAAMSQAVDVASDPRTLFVPVSSDSGGAWINGTGKAGATNGTGNSDIYLNSDGLHPPLAGHAQIASRLANSIRSAINRMANNL